MVSAESLMHLFVESSPGQDAMSIDFVTLLSQLQECGLDITCEQLDDGCLKCAVSDGESVDKNAFKLLMQLFLRSSSRNRSSCHSN